MIVTSACDSEPISDFALTHDGVELTTDADGIACRTWETKVTPTILEFTIFDAHCDCVFEVTQVWGLQCSLTDEIQWCFADVILHHLDKSTGDPIDGYTITFSPLSGLGYDDPCDSGETVAVRVVYGVPFFSYTVTGCDPDTIYTHSHSLRSGGDSATVSVGVNCTDPFVNDYVSQCATETTWCCTDEEYTVYSIPCAGNAFWVACDPGCVRALLCPCQDGASLSFEGQGFWPKKVNMVGDFSFGIYDNASPPNLVETATFSVAVDLNLVCVGNSSYWESDPISVNILTGYYCCIPIGSPPYVCLTPDIAAHTTSITIRVDPPGVGWSLSISYDANDVSCAVGSGIYWYAGGSVPPVAIGSGDQFWVGLPPDCDSHVDGLWTSSPYTSLNGTVTVVGPV